MITILDLQKLSRQKSPEDIPDLARLLRVWAEEDPDGMLAPLLENAGGNCRLLAEVMGPLCGKCVEAENLLLSNLIRRASNAVPTAIDLLKAVCASPTLPIARRLSGAGIVLEDLGRELKEFATVHPSDPMENICFREDSGRRTLLKYGRDMLALARAGCFDDLEMRKELSALVDALLKFHKGNAVIVGEAGVGKTALIELLALCIARGTVPAALADIELYEISVGKLVAGTVFRGMFEQRIEEVVNALQKREKQVLVFIDEIHLLTGAGRTIDSAMDAANLLKPFLARNEIRVVGATTVEEYHRYIAKDKALARRFEEVRLTEPSPAEIKKMVLKQTEPLSKYHAVEITMDLVDAAIALTNQYQPNKNQPDKARDLLDSAASSVCQEGRDRLTYDDLLESLARSSSLPIKRLKGDQRTALRDMGRDLQRQIIGQNHAVDAVMRTISFRRQELDDSERNIGTFLFSGPTGVGKTELGILLAHLFFGRRDALLHIDLAEYSLPGSLSRLIGAAPGFSGHEREGELASFLHNQGAGVLIFDEVEKAHQEIHRFLLGILDNGRVTTASGERLSTRRCIIIVTTNVLTPDQLKADGVGFGGSTRRRKPEEILGKHFPPEFLGRFDELIVFNQLTEQDIRRIIDLRFAESLAVLEQRNIRVRYNPPELQDYLFSRLTDNRAGARGVKRTIDREFLQPLSLALLTVEEGLPIEVILGEEFYRCGRCEVASPEVANIV